MDTVKEDGQSKGLDVASLMTPRLQQRAPPSPPRDWFPSAPVHYSTSETPRMRVLENLAQFPDISQRKLSDVSNASLGLVSKLVHAENPQKEVPNGRRRIIQTPEMESEIQNRIRLATQGNQSMNRFEIVPEIESVTGKHPSSSWVTKFAHSEGIKFVKPKQLEYERKATGSQTIEEFYARVEKDIPDIREIDPSLQINLDELKIKFSTKEMKVIALEKDFKGTGERPVRVQNGDPKWHGTCAVVSSPMKDFPISQLPPIVIFPAVNVPQDAVSLNTSFDRFQFHLAATPKSGWIRDEILVDYARSYVIPYFKLQRKKLNLPDNARAIWWLDGDNSRRNPELIRLCAANFIEIAVFPSNTSSGTQPNDHGIIGSIQQKLKSIKAHDYKARLEGVVNERAALLNALHSACVQTLCDFRITSTAWLRTGVYPWNITVHFLGNETRNHLTPDRVTSSVDTVVPRKGKQLALGSAVLTADPLIADRLQAEADNNASARIARRQKRDGASTRGGRGRGRGGRASLGDRGGRDVRAQNSVALDGGDDRGPALCDPPKAKRASKRKRPVRSLIQALDMGSLLCRTMITLTTMTRTTTLSIVPLGHPGRSEERTPPLSFIVSQTVTRIQLASS